MVERQVFGGFALFSGDQVMVNRTMSSRINRFRYTSPPSICVVKGKFRFFAKHERFLIAKAQKNALILFVALLKFERLTMFEGSHVFSRET
jgi:hypothetical protein